MSFDLNDLGSLAVENNVSGALILDINLIDEDPNQPRTEFDEEALQELADTIVERGVKSPISVHKIEGGRYMINHGARRYRASIIAGKTTIPAIIDDDYTQADQIIENIQRENLKPMEIAKYIESEKAKGLTQKEIAIQLGKGTKYVSDMVTLLSLFPPVKELFDSERFDGVSAVVELNKLYEQDSAAVELWINDLVPDEIITRKEVRNLGQIIKHSKDFCEESNEQPEDLPTQISEIPQSLPVAQEESEENNDDDFQDLADLPDDCLSEDESEDEQVFKTVKEIHCWSEQYGHVTIVFKEAQEGKLFVLTDDGVKDIDINELQLQKVIF